MDEHATFPKKIQYKVNSGDYSHESLELFYRINAVIYKAYEKKKITDLTQYKETVILESKSFHVLHYVTFTDLDPRIFSFVY